VGVAVQVFIVLDDYHDTIPQFFIVAVEDFMHGVLGAIEIPDLFGIYDYAIPVNCISNLINHCTGNFGLQHEKSGVCQHNCIKT